MGRFNRIQGEHAAWVEHNFGEHPAWQPLAGIVEELGELDEALGAHVADEQWCVDVTDAIGDVAIYMMDLCTVQGLDFETDVWSARRATATRSNLVWVGKLAHAMLKQEQGIRCGVGKEPMTDGHNAMVQFGADALHALRVLVWLLEREAWRAGTTFETCVQVTWNNVRRRDWIKYPLTGLEEGG